MLMCDSPTRGGRTLSLGIGVSPDVSNSSTSGATSAEQIFICCANSSDTMFTTNSFVDRILFSVSLVAASRPRTIGQKQITGGLALIPVKKLKGARLRTPSGLIEDTNAIGRGTMAPIMSL